MKYNAIILDTALGAGIYESAQELPAKRAVCDSSAPNSLAELFRAADAINERPCNCIVVTDSPGLTEAARLGGFDAASAADFMKLKLENTGREAP